MKLKLPHFHVSDTCFDLTHAPVATTARAAATGLVSMSTRPDPEGSDTVEIATRSKTARTLHAEGSWGFMLKPACARTALKQSHHHTS